MKQAGCAIAIAAVVMLGSGAAAAQKIEKPKVYVGGSAGLSVGSQRADFIARSRRGVTVTSDGYVSALGVFAGAEFKGLAGELGYVKMGDQDIEITSNRTNDATETVVVARDVLFMTMSHELPWKLQKGIKLAAAVKGGDCEMDVGVHRGRSVRLGSDCRVERDGEGEQAHRPAG